MKQNGTQRGFCCCKGPESVDSYKNAEDIRKLDKELNQLFMYDLEDGNVGSSSR